MLPLLLFLGAIPAVADDADARVQRELAGTFAETVGPFLGDFCLGCHGAQRQEAKLNLSSYASMADVAQDLSRWDMVLERLEAAEMPPEDAPRQPSAEQRQRVIDWARQLRRYQARRTAGDPGPVLPRRLSNAEYDYTIRDLTGVDLRPTREFPIDPANTAGFDNSGESLTMSPALLTKYLAAARYVAEHLVLQPHGFVFAPHPAVTDTDRDKYCVQRIIDFYQRQRTDYADYFQAAWQYRHREALGRAELTLDQLAVERGLSHKYLGTIWSILEQTDHELGPLAELQRAWRELPPAGSSDDAAVRAGCERLRELVERERKQWTSPVGQVTVPGISDGSQPMVLWIDRQLAAQRLRPATDKRPSDPRLRGSVELFCRTFPDAFYVSERGRVFLKEADRNSGRLLSAGFHLMVGYFRDDQPLYELMLDESQQQQLDALWQQLDFVTAAPLRQYKDFVFFERAEPPRFMREAEFDFARSEDMDVTSPDKLQRLAERYLAKARANGGQGEAIAAIETYFAEISQKIRWIEQTRRDAEPSHLAALADFAQRAYRRPLTTAERQELIDFYQALRREQGLSHEDAMRDTVASVLISPYFCYRVEVPAAGPGPYPVSDVALASRLSYFLWSSMPDAELMRLAAAQSLHQPDVLVSQVRRMLRDDRVEGLAREFGGNWLGFRRFEQHNSVDRERFASFTDELRQSMFDEPIRFFVDVVQRDASILDFLDADYTFVNRLLADHYSMTLPAAPAEGAWVRVDQAGRYGRGGLLPMAVFLTQNSPGLRTSPVKRGYWVVRQLLGQRIPPPPPNVPELPKDETQLGDLTLREVLARHRESKSCAGCHERFDALGLVFEGYDPIGRRRDVDLGGRPVDVRAELPGGGERSGFEGLRQYLRDQRQPEFVDNFCRKLLAYALGRSLQLSDQETLEALKARLAAEEYRFGSLIETIVTSPQFLKQRGRDYNHPTSP